MPLILSGQASRHLFSHNALILSSRCLAQHLNLMSISSCSPSPHMNLPSHNSLEKETRGFISIQHLLLRPFHPQGLQKPKKKKKKTKKQKKLIVEFLGYVYFGEKKKKKENEKKETRGTRLLSNVFLFASARDSGIGIKLQEFYV